MLKMMRQSAASGVMKIFVFGLLMAGAVGLALTGGYGFFNGGTGNANLATVGRTRIDPQAFDQTVRRAVAQQGIDAHTALQAGLIDQLLDQQVDTILLSKAARDLGIVIGDNVVRDRIKTLVTPYMTTGMSAKDTLRLLLRNQNMSEGQFVETIRSETATDLLRAALQDGTAVPADTEAADLAVFANEKRDVEIVNFPDGAIRNYKQPDDTVLKPFYEAGVERYAVPETRSFTIALLSAKTLAASQTIGDDELHKMYDDQKDALAIPERRTLDQAILPGQEQAQAVVALVKKGASLKDAVKSATGDTKAYTGSETYQRAGLDKAIADPAFTAPKGGIAGPVQTPLGWHILIVKDITAPQVRPFEDVKEKLRADALSDKANGQLYTASTQLDDELAGGGSLADAAKKYHLDLAKIGPVAADGNTADKSDLLKDFGKDKATILKTAFGLSQGETSQVTSLADGRYAAIHIESITPKSYKSFDAVKPDLGKLWIADQQNVLNKQKVRDLLAQLQAGKTQFTLLGASVKTLTLTRLAAAPEPLIDRDKLDLFKADKGAFISIPTKDGLALARVTGVTLPDLATLPADQLKSIRTGMVQAAQDGVLQSYVDDLRTHYRVTVNRDALKSMYGKKPTDNAAADDQ